MAYYDPNKTYGNGAFGDFMDSGAAKMGQVKSAQQADLDTLVQNLAIEMQEKSGYISSEDAALAREDAAAQIDQDYEENMSRVRSLSMTNTLANTLGIVTSAASFAGIGAAGKAAASATAQAGKAGLGTALKTAWSGASGLGKVGAVTGTLASRGLGAAGTTLLKGVGGMKLTTRLAVSAVPTVAAKLYTTNRTMEEGARMQETINALQSTYDYLSSEDESLTDQIRQDTEAWRGSYESGSQELLEKYQSGEMTQAEYDAAYEAFIREHEQKWSEVQEGHAETAAYVTEHGAAYATDDYIASHGYDPDLVNRRCGTIAKLNGDNPEAYEAAKSKYETMKQMDTGSTFTNFLANMNAVLLHYVPGLAYVEAAAVKAADVVLDFAANKVPVLSSIMPYEEKHKGEGIGEIAKSICTDAEARYELSHSVSAADKVLDEGAESVRAAEAAVTPSCPEQAPACPEPA